MLFSKYSNQFIPTIIPKDNKQSLKILTSHHFNVIGEKIFIYK